MAVGLQAQGQGAVVLAMSALFLAINLIFVFRSFYSMRIVSKEANA
jgi:K(+)-stimulated pyrophosphate-energized sodium pump